MQVTKISFNDGYQKKYRSTPLTRTFQPVAFEGKSFSGETFSVRKKCSSLFSRVLDFVFPKKYTKPELHLPKTNIEKISLLPVEKIDGSNFSKLEGEIVDGGVKVVKDSAGQVLRTYKAGNNGKTLGWVYDYDPQTGRLLKFSGLQKDGKTLSTVTHYDPNTGNRVKCIEYLKDGKTPLYIGEFEPNTGKLIKSILYNSDNTSVYEYDYVSGRKKKRVDYKLDNESLQKIVDYANSGKVSKETYFQQDGRTISYVSEFEEETGRNLQTDFYYPDGKTVKTTYLYDPKTSKEVKEIHYKEDATVDRVIEFPIVTEK